MPRDHYGSNRDQSEYYGALQNLVDSLFPDDWDELGDGDATPGAGPAGGAVGDATPSLGAAADAAATGASAAADAAAAFGVSERAAGLLGLAALVPAAADAEPAAEAACPTVRRLDAILAAEAADLPDELVRIVKLLPPGDYTRARLCTQLNSALAGHAWGQVYGTVE